MAVVYRIPVAVLDGGALVELAGVDMPGTSVSERLSGSGAS